MTTARRVRQRAAPALWSATVGVPPLVVTVYERAPGGPLWMRWWDREAKAMQRVPLGHRNKEQAQGAATAEQERMAHAVQAMTGAPMVPGAARDSRTGDVAATVAGVVALYLAQRTPQKKTAGQRQEDERRGALWTRLFGPRAVESLDDTAWNQFVTGRLSGAINARGALVTDPKKRKPCGPRGVDADLVFIGSVFNWACQLLRPTANGSQPVIARNPWAGAGPGTKRVLVRPRNRKIKRPIATTARYLAVLEAAEQVRTPLPAANGRLAPSPCYLGVLLTLAYHTGRRIEAILRLRWADVTWTAGGAVDALTWPALKDEDVATVPVRPEVSSALIAHRARWLAWAEATQRTLTADAPIFPATRTWVPGRVLVPMTRWLARDWLERAEGVAGLAALDGGDWHPYRRSWATRRKHVPTADAMAAAGWKDRKTFEGSYQHADEAGVRAAILADATLT